MKYVMTWKKKRHGTTADYSTGQQRMLDVMRAWRRPEGVLIHHFVLKVGDPGGYVVFEADDLGSVHSEAAAFAGLNIHIEPVIDIADALAAEGRAIEWADAVV